ncbi:MAG: HAD family hydrolase [Dysosmobacter sp.]|nr:HAD family hydrolase [Dysosmobacter sp.]
MNIRCIALDLDQTTLDNRGRLSPGNRRAMEDAIARGIHIVIASGRALASLPEDVVSVPGIEYAITSNGAAIYHLPTGTCLRRLTLPPRSARDILRLTAGEPVAYEAFVQGEAYAGEDYVRDPMRYGATAQGAVYVRRTRHPVPDILEFIHHHIGELDSLDVVVQDGETKARLMELLGHEVSDLYMTSSVPRLIELSHPQGGKDGGVRFLAGVLGTPMSEVAAFGDGDNDADMLRAVGFGVAVAGATPACLAAADLVTASNDEDGVAQGIHHILKGQEPYHDI